MQTENKTKRLPTRDECVAIENAEMIQIAISRGKEMFALKKLEQEMKENG